MFPLITDPKSWTLFLDRDGVINRKLPDDYVKTWNEFDFLPFVKESLAELKKFFGRIIVITNQQGVGKGLMTEKDLKEIHFEMCKTIENTGGFINKVYFCCDLAGSNSNNRKPASGMAMQAKADFPEIDFTKTVMLGDALSDMEFANNIGAIAVLITNKNFFNKNNKQLPDYVFKNLKEFADFLYEKNNK